MEIFELKIYNDEVKNYLNRNGLDRFLEKKFVARDLGKSHKQMVTENWISKSWLKFIKWHKGGWGRFIFLRPNFLFRGIANYSPPILNVLVSEGNERQDTKDFSSSEDRLLKSKYWLNPNQWIWANDTLVWAWNRANQDLSRSLSGTRLIAVYNGDLLENIEENQYIYKLKEGVQNFRETLMAIVLIEFL